MRCKHCNFLINLNDLEIGIVKCDGCGKFLKVMNDSESMHGQSSNNEKPKEKIPETEKKRKASSSPEFLVLNKRQRVSNKKTPKLDKINRLRVNQGKYNYVIFISGYKTILSSVCSQLQALPSLKNFNSTQRELLAKECSIILHHCQLLWNGTMKSMKIQEGSLQLPKNCVVRVLSVVYYVIHLHLELLVRVDLTDLLADFKELCKKETQKSKLMMLIHTFICLIQEFSLGGEYYKKLETRLLNENTSAIEQSSASLTNVACASGITNFYDNLLEGFFYKHNEYSFASKEITDLYNKCNFTVFLEGKTPRVTQTVCIFYILKLREFIMNYEPFDTTKSIMLSKLREMNKSDIQEEIVNKDVKTIYLIRNYRASRGERGVYFDIDKLIDKNDLEDKLYKKISSYYFNELEDGPKKSSRKKTVFIKNLQKFIKLI